LTVIFFVAKMVPHEPPAVVNLNVTGVPEPAAAVYVAAAGVAPPLFANDPPAPPSVQTADVAPPPNDPPSAADVPPWQIAAIAPPTFTVGLGLTVRILFAEVVPHDPPAVVSVSVTEAGAAAAAVYVVVFGVAPPLFVNEPPAPPSDHTADVAPPPNDPPRANVVPPWQIAATAPPALTVGLGLTVIFFVAKTVPHEPPAVVSLNVTGVPEPAAAVYVAVLGVAPPLFVNEPPAPPSVQTADVAPPPNDPPKAADVPAWQIAAIAPPTFTVGFGLTVSTLLAVAGPHKPPAVVSVSVTEAGAAAAAVYVVVFGVNPPLFVNEPPAPPSDHTADVALPP
jgi:hypothetical protein